MSVDHTFPLISPTGKAWVSAIDIYLFYTDEYETSEVYENVPETASLQSRDSGIYAPLITSMMDECKCVGINL